MTAPNHPKRVVIVDADNPLVEVRGQFFWIEDHIAAVNAARDEAYRNGYRAGWNEAARQAGPHTVWLRRRRCLTGMSLAGIFWLVVLVWLALSALAIADRLAGHF